MRLKSFRVRNYKSIKDTGWIELNDLMQLVGKNQSGKSALLEALFKFNNEDFSVNYDINSDFASQSIENRNSSKIVFECYLALDKDSREKILKFSYLSENKGEEKSEKIIDSLSEIHITKNYENRYFVHLEEFLFDDWLSFDEISDFVDFVYSPSDDQRINNYIKQTSNDMPDAIANAREFLKKYIYRGQFSNLNPVTNYQHNRFKEVRGNSQQNQARDHLINIFADRIKKLQVRLKNNSHLCAYRYILENMPRFIYVEEFPTFEAEGQLEKLNISTQRLLDLAEVNLSALQRSNYDAQQKLLDRGSEKISTKVANTWKQNPYSIIFDMNNNIIRVMIKDESGKERLDQQSTGFRRFVSLDLWLRSESSKSLTNAILLIEEPEIHLHPEAQNELKELLADYSKNVPIIYTTHSPFMVNLDEPQGIRIVERGDFGSEFKEKLSNSHRDSSITIQRALGIEYWENTHVSNQVVSECNLIVEGYDDYKLITAFSNLLSRSNQEGLSDNIQIIPANGAGQIPKFAKFLMAQELNVVALLDTDNAGNRERKKIEDWIENNEGFTCGVYQLGELDPSAKEFAIEDVFSEKFYWQCVEDTYSDEIDQTNIKNFARGNYRIGKRAEDTFKNKFDFSKERVNKNIAVSLDKMQDISQLTDTNTRENIVKLIQSLNELFDQF